MTLMRVVAAGAVLLVGCGGVDGVEVSVGTTIRGACANLPDPGSYKLASNGFASTPSSGCNSAPWPQPVPTIASQTVTPFTLPSGLTQQQMAVDFGDQSALGTCNAASIIQTINCTVDYTQSCTDGSIHRGYIGKVTFLSNDIVQVTMTEAASQPGATPCTRKQNNMLWGPQ